MNDRFLRACRRQPVDRTPIWIMRQAGRYLPEYRELRSRVEFLDLCRTPELAAEVTLQPLRRFPLDAAILFSDILLPLDAFGISMTFTPGPRIAEPIRSRAQVDALQARPAGEAVPFVADAVRLLRRELNGRTPLIGFCGAPFTLAAYLVQGEGKEGFGAVKRMMFHEPATLEVLLDKLAAAMVDYLRLQIQGGVQAVQIFDSWAGILGATDYARFALPYVRAIVNGVRESGVPVIYFVNGAPHLIEAAASAGADVLGVCWRMPIDHVAARVGPGVALQGNLDPHALFADAAVVRERATDVLRRMAGRPGHIMNLGHGILPETPIASVEVLIETVQCAN
ncbi:MAG: uroporphyrinogen decarboxylase [Acidobacteria bacterium RIFCSPLOWO2_12_FULL_67_14b]|nr:MAG: uroporphyrinogen decarboxylase [Acidobacteria bacterium RIFCSPLOWO2_12_FULL_67_14b]